MNTFISTTGNGKAEAQQGPIYEPEPNEVLVKVSHSTLAPFDLYQLEVGFYVQPPHTIVGLDAAGVIAKVGSSVTDLKEGDRVRCLPYVACSLKADPAR
jgi:NADPH:quinone reductase-like Zn-dependent oxidoreductase